MVMKSNRIIAALLSAAALFASCENEISVTLEEELITLDACIGNPDTRIHFTGDNGLFTEIRWEADDCIWVRSDTQAYWERGDCFKTSEANISADGHSARFQGRTRVEGRLSAVYPYDLVLGGSDNDKVCVSVAQTNKLVPGDCPAGSNVAAAFWADGANSFSMQYVLGAIKFSLTGNGEKVSQFVLIDADSSNSLWGVCEITPDYDAKGIASVTMVNDDPSRNRIILETDMTLGGTPQEFYFMVPAGSFSKGFSLRVYGMDGKLLSSITTKKANTVGRGKVLVMPSAKLEPITDGTIPFEGSGSEQDPYLISSSGNLSYMSSVLSSDDYAEYAGKHYKQTADIDMSSVVFKPLCPNADKPFTGVYDGSGKAISNLSVSGLSSDNPASGLFGYATGAEIKQLTVTKRVNTGSFNRVGGIVGYAKDCLIESCHITGGELGASANMCGGIVAEMHGGMLAFCTAKGVRIVNTKNYAGGIVAYAHDGTVIRLCEVNEGAEVSAANEVGGIAGKIDGGQVYMCKATNATITAGSEDAGAIGGWIVGGCSVEGCNASACGINAVSYAGGIVGLLEKSTVISCQVTDESKVSVTKNCAGGIAGYLKKAEESVVDMCLVSTGSTVSGVQNIGGIVGWLDTGTIRSCAVMGVSVNGSGDGVGGIVGRAISKNGTDNVIESCNVGSTVTGSYSVGGILGYAYPDKNGKLLIVNCGVDGSTVRATACDTGRDPSSGDSMSGGICGWMRLSDSGSKGYIQNCYSYMKELICDLPMVHPSVGGLLGYGSVSSAGALEIVNCVSNLVNARLIINGAANTGASQAGTLFGKLPNSAVVKVSQCFYQDDGVLGIGADAPNAVIVDNTGYPESVFLDGSTICDKLNANAGANDAWSTWSVVDGLPKI